MKTKFRLIMVFLLLMLALPTLAMDEGVATGALDAPVTYEDVLNIGVPIGALLIALAALLRSGKSGQIDQTASGWFQQRQADRDYMEKLERAYEQANKNQRQLFDTFASTLRAFAPYTPFGFDEAAARFATDIQQPGMPTDNAGSSFTAQHREKLE